jgi:hypothetical protein
MKEFEELIFWLDRESSKRKKLGVVVPALAPYSKKENN